MSEKNERLKRLREPAATHVTRDSNWSKWSGPGGFPKRIETVATEFRAVLRSQGHNWDEIEEKLYGIVWEWYYGHFDYDDLQGDSDIFEEY